jgi:exodeoxyribonuclease VII small subunit
LRREATIINHQDEATLAQDNLSSNEQPFARMDLLMPEKVPPATTAPLSFEAGLQQLEAIVKEMEGGELPLERALELFERGMKLSDACRKQLEEAETRVEVLMRRAGSAAGEEKVQPHPFRTDKA